MELPEDLKTALDEELTNVSRKDLSKTAADLSARYRAKGPASGDSLIRSPEDALAYVAFRMPATFGAIYGALTQVREVLPQWEPSSLLDVGAGPGTVMWAVREVFPTVQTITLLERAPAMIALGQGLAERATSTSLRTARWLQQDITQDWHLPPQDLVVASYVLGETNPKDRDLLLARLWQHTKGVLVIIEPGTPEGFGQIRAARDWLRDNGGHIVAPCPHRETCPLADDDWCHFSQRIPRSRLHRQIKASELSYEDEKFSFAAFSRQRATPFPGRVLRHPLIGKGHVQLTLCRPAGITKETVSRKNKDLYRAARKAKWGDIFPPGN